MGEGRCKIWGRYVVRTDDDFVVAFDDVITQAAVDETCKQNCIKTQTLRRIQVFNRYSSDVGWRITALGHKFVCPLQQNPHYDKPPITKKAKIGKFRMNLF